MVDWELFVSIGCWVALEGHRDPLIPVMRREVKAVEKVTASTYNSQTGLLRICPGSIKDKSVVKFWWFYNPRKALKFSVDLKNITKEWQPSREHIPHCLALLKIMFLFPIWDMLVSWRVFKRTENWCWLSYFLTWFLCLRLSHCPIIVANEGL